jgi:hypothetical protein
MATSVGVDTGTGVAPPLRNARGVSILDLPVDLQNKILEALLANRNGDALCEEFVSFCGTNKGLCFMDEEGNVREQTFFRKLLDSMLEIDLDQEREDLNGNTWDYGGLFVNDEDILWAVAFFELCKERHLTALVDAKELWKACKLFMRLYIADESREKQDHPFTLDALVEKGVTMSMYQDVLLMQSLFDPFLAQGMRERERPYGDPRRIGADFVTNAQWLRIEEEIYWPWFQMQSQPGYVSLVAVVASLGMLELLREINDSVGLNGNVMDSRGRPILVGMVREHNREGDITAVAECMQLLIDAGEADVNAPGEERDLMNVYTPLLNITPLYNAIEKQDLACALLLLQADADPDLPSYLDRTPAQYLESHLAPNIALSGFVETLENEMQLTRQRLQAQ